jgi:hypothetical protein
MWDPIHLCPSRQDDDGARGGDDDDHHGLLLLMAPSRAGRRRSAGRWCARDRAGPRVAAQRSVEVRSGVNAAGCLPACLSVVPPASACKRARATAAPANASNAGRHCLPSRVQYRYSGGLSRTARRQRRNVTCPPPGAPPWACRMRVPACRPQP